MTDIEVKRKELGTAKIIRNNGYSCFGDELTLGCNVDQCPCNGNESGCLNWTTEQWDNFIATREAELAELNKKELGNHRKDKMPESARLDQRQGCNHSMPSTGTTGTVYTWKPDQTVDDFALTLIQGGFGITEP